MVFHSHEYYFHFLSFVSQKFSVTNSLSLSLDTEPKKCLLMKFEILGLDTHWKGYSGSAVEKGVAVGLEGTMQLQWMQFCL